MDAITPIAKQLAECRPARSHRPRPASQCCSGSIGRSLCRSMRFQGHIVADTGQQGNLHYRFHVVSELALVWRCCWDVPVLLRHHPNLHRPHTYVVTYLSYRHLTDFAPIAFTVDLYLPQAASALAAQVACRAIAACAFPLFSTQVSGFLAQAVDGQLKCCVTRCTERWVCQAHLLYWLASRFC